MLPKSEERRTDLRNVSVMEVIIAVILILMVVIYQKDIDLLEFGNDRTELQLTLQKVSDQNKELSEENRQLNAKLNNLIQEKIILETQLSHYKKLLKNKEEQYDELFNKYNLMYEELDHKSQEYIELRLDNEKLKNEVQKLTDKIKLLEKGFNDTEKDLIELQLKIKDLELENLELKNSLLLSGSKEEEIRQKELENNELRKEMMKLKIKLSILNDQVGKDKKENYKIEIEKLLKQITILNEKISTLKSDLSKKDKQLTIFQSLKREESSLMEENISLKEQLFELQKRLLKYEDGEGGIGAPLCKDVSNSPNYKQKGLAKITAIGDKFKFELFGDLQVQKELIDKVPGVKELATRGLISKKDMSRFGNKILAWSQGFKSECRFRAFYYGDLNKVNLKFLNGYFIGDW